MRNTPDKRNPASRGTGFSETECGRLRTLNEQLVRAEQWISRRSHELVTAYSLATVQARHVEQLDEDVELVATILFLTAVNRPDSRAGHPDIVTRIDIPILPPPSHEEDACYKRTGATSPFPGCSDDWCALFLNLYERVLQRDVVKLLDIDSLCIDVALIQQHLSSW